MNAHTMDVIVAILRIMIGLYWTLIGARVIRAVSKFAHSVYFTVAFASFIMSATLPPVLSMIMLILILVLLICDQVFLPRLKAMVFLDIHRGFDGIKDIIASDTELSEGMTINGGHVKFNDHDRKAVKRKMKTIIRRLNESKEKLDFKERIFGFVMFNTHTVLATALFIVVVT